MKSLFLKLKKASKPFLKKGIKDIIVFGSFMRGKQDYKDIDILLVFEEKVDKDLEVEYRKKLNKITNKVDVTSKTKKNYKDSSFIAKEGILFEGYSIKSNEFFSTKYGFRGLGFFFYKTNNLNNRQKTKFYYALNGRNTMGVLESLNGFKVSDNVIAFPIDKIDPAKEFLDFWKLDYRYVPTLIPERLAKKRFIGKD